MSELLHKRIQELEKANEELMQTISTVKIVYEKYVTNFGYMQMFLFDRFQAK